MGRRTRGIDSDASAAVRPRAIAASVGAAAAALLVGCAATPQLDAQWSDASLDAGFLHGARVLVACDAYEVVVRQICQDQLARQILARGATPVFLAPGFPVATDRSVDAQLLPAAREAGAKAMIVMTVAIAVQDVSQPFQIGIGGFGFGSGGSAGVGVSAPVGGGRITSGYSANGRLTDVPTGRLVWTAKATAPPSSDINAQMSELSRLVLGAADTAGLF